MYVKLPNKYILIYMYTDNYLVVFDQHLPHMSILYYLTMVNIYMFQYIDPNQNPQEGSFELDLMKSILKVLYIYVSQEDIENHLYIYS